MKKFILGLVISLFGFTSLSFAQNVPYAINNGSNVGGATVVVQNFDDLFNGINGGTGVTPGGRFELPNPNKFNRIGENTSLREYILRVLNFILTFLGLVAVAMVIYGGYLYIFSMGEDSNIEKGKKIIIYGVIGILVILASFALVNTVIKNAGLGTRDNINAPQLNPINPTTGVQNGSTGGVFNNGTINTNGTQTTTTVLPNGTVVTNDSILTGDTPTGTVVSPNGTKIELATTTGTGSGVFQNFYNAHLITVKPAPITTDQGVIEQDNNENKDVNIGKGLVELGNVIVATPRVGRNGIEFGLGIDGAQALIDFGDRTQALIDTRSNSTQSTLGKNTIVHHFGSEGTYNIRAIIQTPEGEKTSSRTLIIGGVTAKFTASNTTLRVGERAQLDASTSKVEVGGVRDYVWTCRNSDDTTVGCFGGTYGQNPTIQFDKFGEYTVKLTVESVVGSSASYERKFTVLGEKPEANFTFEATSNTQKPAEYRFNASLSKNIRGLNQGLIYFWDFDGDVKQVNSSETIYEFKSTGSKTVKLVVAETGGKVLKSEEVQKSVNVKTTVPIDFEIN